MRLAGPTFAVVLVALMAACGPPDLGDRLARYEATIARIAAADAVARPARTAARLPARRVRRIEVADHRIGGRNFLAIQGCRLSVHIGERNGPMGRVMVPSRRLIYELSVLETAGDCLAGLGSTRAAALASVLERKRAELPAHVWNAVWIGEEMEAYLSSVPNWFAARAPRDATAGVEEVVRVLQRPVRLVADGEDLEAALVRMGNAYPAGVDLRLLERVGWNLQRVASLVEGREASGCRGVDVRLTSAFEQHYLPQQQDLVRLDRRARARLDALDALFEASAAWTAEVPPAMRDYHRSILSPHEREGAWSRYRRAVERHARAWEPVLKRCGLLPRAEAP